MGGYGAPIDDAYDEMGQKRYECAFGPDGGVTVATTVGPQYPTIPLSHVVYLMMENRSFDHYFGAMGGLRPDVDGVIDQKNFDPITREDKPQQHLTTPTISSTNHEWAGSHLQYDDGLMDGFVMSNNPDGERAMGYYNCDDIPFFYWLANTFAMSDHHFSSLLGPTWPNRLFAVAATSCGFGEGSETDDRLTFQCGHVRDNLFHQLKRAGISYRVYDDGIPSIASLFFLTGALNDFNDYGDINDFEGAVAGGTLPAVSIIEPHYQAEVDVLGSLDGEANDDHPPANIQNGQNFVYRIVKALTSNQTVWNQSALFITYDEHGGFYDHVPPPPACEPDPSAANPPDYRFNRYGFRVPLMVVSPYAKAGYVSKRTTDHTSILRFIQGWKGLPALTRRDANAWPMLDLFDFSRAPAPPPDLSAIDVGVTAGKQALCHPSSSASP